MNRYDIFIAGRGGGKSHWMVEQIEEALEQNQRVAVVFPHSRRSAHVTHQDLRSTPVDIYTERSFEWSRGMTYDRIFVDNAHDFHDDPIALCALFHPGVPATFTYTPYPFG